MSLSSGRWIVILFTLLLSPLGSARTLDDVIASGYIEIAVYSNFPPYSYLDKQQQPTGIDIELGKIIAKKLNVTPRWFWMTAGETVDDDLRNAVWKGHYLNKRVADLMMRVPYDREYSYAIDGYGAAKHEHVVMFAPYHQEQWVFARNLEKVGDVRNLAIFQYQKVGVELDSLPDFFLSGAINGRLRKNVVHYTSVFDALADLESGDISAVAGMRSQLEWGLGGRTDSNIIDIDSDGLEQLSKQQWDIGFAVKQTNRQLSHSITLIIEEATSDGQIAALFKQQGLSYQNSSFY
jgi:ABC-type amino acid transport substrate-binding protein